MTLDVSTMLSPHFSLWELTRTATGLPNRPSADDIANLVYLCDVALEPIRDKWGPWWVTSGYRCEEVNSKLRELGYFASPTSQHRYGEASDGRPVSRLIKLWDVFSWVKASTIPYDQVIFYGASKIIHISASRHHAPKRETLVFLNK